MQLDGGRGEGKEGDEDLHPSMFRLLWNVVFVAIAAITKIILGVLDIMECRNKNDLGVKEGRIKNRGISPAAHAY